MCRAIWLTDPSLSQLEIKSELDPEAIQLYLDYLYTSTLRIDESVNRAVDAFNLRLLKLWAVANAVRDDDFKALVVTTFFDEAKARFWTDSVKWAFVDRKCDKEIRDFVIDITLAYIEKGWFTREAKHWPEVFVMELADAAMVRWGKRKSFGEQKKIWMQRLGVEDEEEEAPPPSSCVWRDENRAAYLDRINQEASKDCFL